MRRLALLALLALSACAPRPAEAPPVAVRPGVVVVRDAEGRVLLNPGLGLGAPPGAVVLEQAYRGAGSDSRFTHPWEFDRVLSWLRAELKAMGWRVEELHIDEVPGSFGRARLVVSKGDRRLVVELRWERGVYWLEVRR